MKILERVTLISAVMSASLLSCVWPTLAQTEVGLVTYPYSGGGPVSSITTGAYMSTHNLYIVAFGFETHINGFQMGFEFSPGVHMISSFVPLHLGWLNFSSGFDALYVREHCLETTPVFTLGQIEVLVDGTVPDALVCLRGVDPDLQSLFIDVGGLAYSECPTNDQHVFALAQNGAGAYPDGCFVFNPTREAPIANTIGSFGSIKSLYR